MLLQLHGWLPDLLEAHLETADFLWPQWADARLSPDYLLGELERLQERLEANLDALVLAGDEASALIEQALDGGSPALITTAALVLLRQDARAAVLDRLPAVAPAAALAIGEALALLDLQAPIDGPLAALQEDAGSSPAVVVAATRALLLRGRAVPAPDRVIALLTDEAVDAPLLAAAWRCAGELAAQRLGVPILRATFEGALSAEDPAVAEAAWHAAAWSRQPWLLAHAARHAPADVRALAWLARLGAAPERARVIEAMGSAALGPERFAAAARLGHLDVADALLLVCADPAPEVAVPAAAALWRITDLRHNLDATAALVGPDGDPDLAETAHLPDVPALLRSWSKLRGSYAAGARWARGLDADAAELDALDCAARADRLIREVYHGRRPPRLALLDRFPITPAPTPRP